MEERLLYIRQVFMNNIHEMRQAVSLLAFNRPRGWGVMQKQSPAAAFSVRSLKWRALSLKLVMMQRGEEMLDIMSGCCCCYKIYFKPITESQQVSQLAQLFMGQSAPTVYSDTSVPSTSVSKLSPNHVSVMEQRRLNKCRSTQLTNQDSFLCFWTLRLCVSSEVSTFACYCSTHICVKVTLDN